MECYRRRLRLKGARHRQAFLHDLHITLQNLFTRYGGAEGDAFRLAVAIRRGANVSDVLSMRAQLAASPATVYRALTEEALRLWLAEHAEVSVPGERFAFWRYTPQGETGRQQLVVAEPDRLLRLVCPRWRADRSRGPARTGRHRGYGPGLPVGQPADAGELMALPPDAGTADTRCHTFWGAAIANLAEFVEGRELTRRPISARRGGRDPGRTCHRYLS
jgi:hypothetical protein